jgi:tRNA nucleotidyltransferase (CCA-adding enzyme)
MQLSLPKSVIELMELFEKNNFEIYIVGGAVRDLLMGKDATDWDFTTNAAPDEMLAFLPEDAYYTNAFGTVGIPQEDSTPFEITTYRTEHGGYSDNRRPDEVRWGKTLEEDLQRRDFTINAMALQVTGNKTQVTGKEKNNSQLVTCYMSLIDLFNGQNDIEKQILRTVGDPHERFSEDALRMMRAVRIAGELGFTIEEDTLEAVKINAALINKISRERVRDELFKILSSKDPVHGIMLLRETTLLQLIIPELEKAFGVEQKSPGRHHIYDVGTHLINSLAAVAERNTDVITRFATLIHDIGKPQTFRKLETGTITFYNHEVVGAAIAKRIADRLRFSNEQKEKLWRLVRYHQFTVNEGQTDSALRRFIVNVTPEYLNDMIDLRVGDRLGSGSTETSWRTEEFKKRLIEVQKQPFAIKDLKVSGNDVMEILQIPAGKKVGEVLNDLFKQVVEEQLSNEKDVLLKSIANYAKENK